MPYVTAGNKPGILQVESTAGISITSKKVDAFNLEPVHEPGLFGREYTYRLLLPDNMMTLHCYSRKPDVQLKNHVVTLN